MKYEFTNDVCCPECKSVNFKIEERIEKDMDGNVVMYWWDIYCGRCAHTIIKIDR